MHGRKTRTISSSWSGGAMGKSDKKDKKDKKDRKDKKDKKDGRKRRRDSSTESEGSADGRRHGREEKFDVDREKEERKAKKKAEKIAKALGYSNETNPFGDSNLLNPFSWDKKKERDKMTGKSVNDSTEKRISLMKDIEKVRDRRRQREEEIAEMERLRDEEQRLREEAQYGDWQEKEDEFLLQQTQVRSKIRLTEDRRKPVDRIAQGIILIEAYESKEPEDREITLNLVKTYIKCEDPLLIVSDLNEMELEELCHEVETYVELEKKKAGRFVAFWESLLELVKVDLMKIRLPRNKTSLHKNVDNDIKDMIYGKNIEDLRNLVNDITKTIQGGENVDIEYWEVMSKEINYEIARKTFQEIYSGIFVKECAIVAEMMPILQAAKSSSSPSSAEMNGDEDVTSGEIGDSEHKMDQSDELDLVNRKYSWQDKYRPRKPRYFNRIKTGYDWNKYNSTHYDHDNPPPKTVQGYKFNIFYPDLIDITTTPRYFLEPAEEKQFAILRFSAGPPYQDVAFKIINKQWHSGRFSGFKCIFERGVLQLHFNFKRQWYRR